MAPAIVQPQLEQQATKPEPSTPTDASNAPEQQGLFTSEERAAMRAAWDAVIVVDASASQEAQGAQRDGLMNTLGGAYINLVFDTHPELMQFFAFSRGLRRGELDPAKMQAHGSKVLGVVDAVVGMIERREDAKLSAAVESLVKRHIGYKVQLEHYDQVLGVLASFLSAALQSLNMWDDLQATAWAKFISITKGVAAKVYAERAAARSGQA